MMADTMAVDIIAEDLPEFPELVRMYQRMVFSVAYHFLHNRAVAEEVAQDVFLRPYRYLDSHASNTKLNDAFISASL
jgi:RNA polymerase sigma-70 factor (ECF subfamily)